MHRTALPLVLIFLVFFYCSESDDKKNENNNFFSINSERYPINRAGIIEKEQIFNKESLTRFKGSVRMERL